MASLQHIDCNCETSPRRAHVVRRLVKSRELIEDSYQEPLTLADLAAAAFMSEAHFVRQFHREFGITPYRCLTERRLEASRQLLTETGMPIADVVAAAGFGNRCAFSRLFKSHYGISPQGYRSRHQRVQTRLRHPRRIAAAAVATLLLAVIGSSFAQSTKPPAACTSSEHRQFDFWVGTWSVTNNDKPAGVNTIRSRHGGCVLEEDWQSAQGPFSGSSLNMYDSARGVWHQTWTDSSGTLLQLEGGLQDGRMVLTGERPARNGSGLITHRISWTPEADGTVQQRWEALEPGAEEWKVLFDGSYSRTE